MRQHVYPVSGGLHTQLTSREASTYGSSKMAAQSQQRDEPDLTVTEAAQRLSVSRDTVYRYLQRGVITYRTISLDAIRPTYRIPAADIDRLLLTRCQIDSGKRSQHSRRSVIRTRMPSLKLLRIDPDE